ncbi:thioredoxin-like protein [Macroventuria anomochaeta]|uniref:Thioredoxin-like protein n=1 Tax=Macroventuria anomochaeta TaxID=301207 RepID=A0ACB6RV26_9PLEO|nr:thioredoxin-like protein [Macroventuria anomochaeta]KAF2625137.1 thioredoxin-like protein [Macroventuria anomochaeta]
MTDSEDQPQQLINGELKPLSGMEATSQIPVLKSKAEYLKAVMYEGVTILEGTATWCAQCKTMAPEVAKMVTEYPNVRFYLYDIEECEDVAQELGVRSMPTFSIFKDGDIQHGVTGARPKEIRKAIEACL